MAITYDQRKGQLSDESGIIADLYLTDEQEYLAYLWRAAPDLLAACEAALEAAAAASAPITNQLRSAIAKARQSDT